MCYCEGIEYFISNAFRTLQTVPWDLSLRRQRIEINV